MEAWFINMLFGHLFGDFLLQNKWMALNKKDDDLACYTHCFVYTMIVMLFMTPYLVGTSIVAMATIVFMSHYVLDGTGLLDWWFDFYGIRSYDEVIKQGKSLHSPSTVHNSITISFGSIVYAVSDNTLHLFMMWLIFLLFL